MLDEQQITLAAAMWRAGKDTKEIASALQVPQAVVANFMNLIRRRADEMKATQA